VPERTIAAFQKAFEWCEDHREAVRAAGKRNAEVMLREWSWDICSRYDREAYRNALAWADRPMFRNDDVSWDTSLESLRRFCGVFQKYGQTQTHGVTLRGCTNAIHMHGGTAVQYEGFGSLSELDNATIRSLSEGKAIEDRSDLIQWLNQTPDELALHGLYHTDYSAMSARDQDQDMAEGLALMKRLFPKKRIRYFIAPFNRTTAATYEVGARHGLTVLAADGIHLEEQLDRLEARPRTWYRYHHHRFYPESRFSYHELSIEKLDAAFARNFNAKATGLSGAPLVRPIVASTSFSPHSLWSRWLASKWRLSPQIGRGDAPN